MSTKLYSDGYICDAERRNTLPTWSDWTYVESTRRTMTLLFLIEMLLDINIGFFDELDCSGFDKSPLPCSKELWEAMSWADWEVKYRRFLDGRRVSEMLTFGTLRDSQGLQRSALGREWLDDLGRWSEGLDGFGTMIMMAALASRG
jgi:hypothetical protein